jgi:protein O-mannosyl-transferase
LVNLGGAFTMADRYMYLPGIGLYIVLAWGGARLAEKWPRQSWLLGTCGALAIVVFAICGVWQTSIWHDDVTMWRHALACAPGTVEAEGGLADALWRQGRLEDAIPLYQRAIRHAEDSVPLTNFGMVLAQLGKLDEAAALLRRAVAVQPGSYNAQVDLGLVLTERRELKEAEEHLRRAVELNPRGASAHYGLARLLLLEGQVDEACQQFQRAIALNPVDPAIRSDLAAVLLKRGKIDEALAQLQAALAIDADSVMVHVNLARALAMRGQHSAALEHCHRALAIDPRNAVARAQLDELLHSVAARPDR